MYKEARQVCDTQGGEGGGKKLRGLKVSGSKGERGVHNSLKKTTNRHCERKKNIASKRES